MPMILEFAQKSFPTQYLLPFYCFERIFNLTNQPLFHPTTILPSLPAPTAIGLEDSSDRFTVQERFHFLQPGVTPVAAPAALSQTFPALNWRSLAQRYSSHRIEMQISAHLQQIFFGLDDRTLESALKQMPDYLMPAIKVNRVRGL